MKKRRIINALVPLFPTSNLLSNNWKKSQHIQQPWQPITNDGNAKSANEKWRTLCEIEYNQAIKANNDKCIKCDVESRVHHNLLVCCQHWHGVVQHPQIYSFQTISVEKKNSHGKKIGKELSSRDGVDPLRHSNQKTIARLHYFHTLKFCFSWIVIYPSSDGSNFFPISFYLICVFALF